MEDIVLIPPVDKTEPRMPIMINHSVVDVIRRTHSDGDFNKPRQVDEDDDPELKEQLKPLDKLKKLFSMVAIFYTVLGNMASSFETISHKNIIGACQVTSWFGRIQWIGVPFFAVLSILSSFVSFLAFLVLIGVIGKTLVEAFRMHRWNRLSNWSADHLTKHQMEQRHDSPFVYMAISVGSILAATWVIAFFDHEDSVHQDFHSFCKDNLHEKLTTVAAWMIKIAGWTAAVTCFLSSLVFVFIFVFYLTEYYGFYRREKRKAFPKRLNL